MIFVGVDWAEAHHDVYVCDGAGARLAARRLPEGVAGIGALHELLAAHATDPGDVCIGIETDRGLWVGALVEAGYTVYAINPKAASRYRDRHTLSGAKSGPGDAKMLAELVRTDRHNHRRVAGDSDLAEGVKILARAHQNLIWDRTRATNRLRCALREYFPAALATFAELADRDTLAVLGRAATPAQARALTPGRIRTLLRAAGRTRNIEARAQAIATGLRADALAAPDAVVSAFAATTRSAVAVIAEQNRQIAALEAEHILNSTRTPTSTSPSQESVSPSAPGRSASSATTRTAMPTPSLAATPPAHHPSPGHPATAASLSLASSATAASLTPSTNGRSAR